MIPRTRFWVELFIWIAVWQTTCLILDNKDRKIQILVYSLIFISGMIWFYTDPSDDAKHETN